MLGSTAPMGFMGAMRPGKAAGTKAGGAVDGGAATASLPYATLGELRLEPFAHPPTVNLGSCVIGSGTAGLVKAVNVGPKALTLSVEPVTASNWSVSLLSPADAEALSAAGDTGAAAEVGSASIAVPESGFVLIRVCWSPEKEARVRQNFWLRINGKSRTNIFVLASAVTAGSKIAPSSVPAAAAVPAPRVASAPSRPQQQQQQKSSNAAATATASDNALLLSPGRKGAKTATAANNNIGKRRPGSAAASAPSVPDPSSPFHPREVRGRRTVNDAAIGSKNDHRVEEDENKENGIVVVATLKTAGSASSSRGPPPGFLARMAAHTQAKEERDKRLAEERKLAAAAEEKREKEKHEEEEAAARSRSNTRTKANSTIAAARSKSREGTTSRSVVPEVLIFVSQKQQAQAQPDEALPLSSIPAPAVAAALAPSPLPTVAAAADRQSEEQAAVVAPSLSFSPPPTMAALRKRAATLQQQKRAQSSGSGANAASSSSSSSLHSKAEDGTSIEIFFSATAPSTAAVPVPAAPAAASLPLPKPSRKQEQNTKAASPTSEPAAELPSSSSSSNAAASSGAGALLLAFSPPVAAKSKRAKEAAAKAEDDRKQRRLQQQGATGNSELTSTSSSLAWVIDAKTLPPAIPLPSLPPLPRSNPGSPAGGIAAAATMGGGASPADIAVATSLAGAKKRRLAGLCGLVAPASLLSSPAAVSAAADMTAASLTSFTRRSLPRQQPASASSPSAAVLAWRISIGGLATKGKKAAATAATAANASPAVGSVAPSQQAHRQKEGDAAAWTIPTSQEKNKPKKKSTAKLLASLEQRRRLAALLKSQEQQEQQQLQQAQEPAASAANGKKAGAAAAVKSKVLSTSKPATLLPLPIPMPIRSDPAVHAQQLASALSAWLTAALTGQGHHSHGNGDQDDLLEEDLGQQVQPQAAGDLEESADSSSFETLAYQQMLASSSSSSAAAGVNPRLLAFKRREARAKLAAFKLLNSHAYFGVPLPLPPADKKPAQQEQQQRRRDSSANVLANGVRIGISAIGSSSSAALTLAAKRRAAGITAPMPQDEQEPQHGSTSNANANAIAAQLRQRENFGLAGLIEQLQLAVDAGTVSLKQGAESWRDLGIRASIADLLMATYTPEWLKLGLETVTGAAIAIPAPASSAAASAAPRPRAPASAQQAGEDKQSSGSPSSQSSGEQDKASKKASPSSAFTSGLLRSLGKNKPGEKRASRSAAAIIRQRKAVQQAAKKRAASAVPSSPSAAPAASTPSPSPASPPAVPQLSPRQMKAAFEMALRRTIIHKLCCPSKTAIQSSKSKRAASATTASSSGDKGGAPSRRSRSAAAAHMQAHAHLNSQASEKHYNASHAAALVKRLLSLVLFLDAAHAARVLSTSSAALRQHHHQPCLFKPSSLFKSTESVLTAFATGNPGNNVLFRSSPSGGSSSSSADNDRNSTANTGIGLLKVEVGRSAGGGDLVKLLTSLGARYRVHQHRMEEYAWPSKSGASLATDLRDGVRLMRLVEVLSTLAPTSSSFDGGLEPLQLCKAFLRLPAPTRTNRLHNLEASLKAALTHLAVDTENVPSAVFAVSGGVLFSRPHILQAVKAALGGDDNNNNHGDGAKQMRSRSAANASKAPVAANAAKPVTRPVSSPPGRPSSADDKPLTGLAALFAERQRKKGGKSSVMQQQQQKQGAASPAPAAPRTSFIGRRSVYSNGKAGKAKQAVVPCVPTAAIAAMALSTVGENGEVIAVPASSFSDEAAALASHPKAALSLAAKTALIQTELKRSSPAYSVAGDGSGWLRTPFAIRPKDIVDGHAAKSMSLLWTLLSHGAAGSAHPLLASSSASLPFYFERLNKETAILRRKSPLAALLASSPTSFQPVCAPAGFASTHAPFSGSDLAVPIPTAAQNATVTAPKARAAKPSIASASTTTATTVGLCPCCLGTTAEVEGQDEGSDCQECRVSKASKVLLRWAQAAAANASAVRVLDGDLSFADGRAIASLIAFYHPEALPKSSIQQKTVLASLVAAPSASPSSSSSSSAPSHPVVKGALLLKPGATKTIYVSSSTTPSPAGVNGAAKKQQSARSRLFERLRAGKQAKQTSTDPAAAPAPASPVGRKTSLLQLALEAEAHNWQLIAKACRFLGIPKAAYSSFLRVAEAEEKKEQHDEAERAKEAAERNGLKQQPFNIFAPRMMTQQAAGAAAAVAQPQTAFAPVAPSFSHLPRTVNSLCPPSPAALHYLLSCLATKLLDTTAELKACLVIRRAWRGVLAARQAKIAAALAVIRRKMAARQLGRWYRYQMLPALPLRQERRRRGKAAVVIQHAYAAYKQRKAAKELAAKKAAARALFAERLRLMAEEEAQKAVAVAARRGVTDQTRLAQLSRAAVDLATRHKAATFIQAAVRGRLARKRVARGLRAVVKMQALYRAYRETKGGLSMRVDFTMMKGAAVMIQSVVRMAVVRAQFLRLRRAAVAIQRKLRSDKTAVEKEMREQSKAAVLIQRCVRRWLARSLMELRHAAASMIAATWKMHCEKERYAALCFAVVSLQERFRMRRDARAIRIAAVAEASEAIAAKLQEVAAHLPSASVLSSSFVLPASPASFSPQAASAPSSGNGATKTSSGYLLDTDVAVPLPPRLSLSLGVRFSPSHPAAAAQQLPSSAGGKAALAPGSASGQVGRPPLPLPLSGKSSKTPLSHQQQQQAGVADLRLSLRSSAEAAKRRLSIGSNGLAEEEQEALTTPRDQQHSKDNEDEGAEDSETFATPESDGGKKSRARTGFNTVEAPNSRGSNCDDEGSEVRETAAAAQRNAKNPRKGAQRIPLVKAGQHETSSRDENDDFSRQRQFRPVRAPAAAPTQEQLQRQWKMAASGKVVSRFLIMAAARLRYMRTRRACVVIQRFSRWCLKKLEAEVALGARLLIASSVSHYYQRRRLLSGLRSQANVFRFVVRPGMTRLQALCRGAKTRSELLDVMESVAVIEDWWPVAKNRRVMLGKAKELAAAAKDARQKAEAKERLRGRKVAVVPAALAPAPAVAEPSPVEMHGLLQASPIASAFDTQRLLSLEADYEGPETSVKKGKRRGFASGDSDSEDDSEHDEARESKEAASRQVRFTAAAAPGAASSFAPVAAVPALISAADSTFTEEDLHIAATFIQSCWRGHVQLERYRLYRYMVVCIQRAWRCYVARSFFVAHYQPIAQVNKRQITLPNLFKIGVASAVADDPAALEGRRVRSITRAAQSTLVQRLLSRAGAFGSPAAHNSKQRRQPKLSPVLEASAEQDADETRTSAERPLSNAIATSSKSKEQAALDDSQILLKLQLQELEASQLLQQLSPVKSAAQPPSGGAAGAGAVSAARSAASRKTAKSGARATPASVAQLLAMNSSFASSCGGRLGDGSEDEDEEHDLIDAYAAVIQACWRGYLTRVSYRAILHMRQEALSLIQPWLASAIPRWRKRKARESHEKLVAGVKKAKASGTLSFSAFKRGVIAAQACWRGHVARKARSSKVAVAAYRIAIATRNAVAGVTLTLGRRTTAALRVLATSRQLTRILAAVAELEVATRLSPLCAAACVAINIAPALFALMRSCNKEFASHTTLLRKAVGVLRNIAAVPSSIKIKGGLTRDAVASTANWAASASASSSSSTSSKYAHVIAGAVAQGVPTLVAVLQEYRDQLAVVRPTLDFLFTMSRQSGRVRTALAGDGIDDDEDDATTTTAADAKKDEGILPTEAMRRIAGLRTFYGRKAEQLQQLQLRARLEANGGQVPAPESFDPILGITTSHFSPAGTCREYNRLLALLRLHLLKEKEHRAKQAATKAAKKGGKKSKKAQPASLAVPAMMATPAASAAVVAAASDPLLAGVTLEHTPEDAVLGARKPRARQPHEPHTLGPAAGCSAPMATRSQAKANAAASALALAAAQPAAAPLTTVPILANSTTAVNPASASAKKKVLGRAVSFNFATAEEAAPGIASFPGPSPRAGATSAAGGAFSAFGAGPRPVVAGLPPKSPGRRTALAAVTAVVQPQLQEPGITLAQPVASKPLPAAGVSGGGAGAIARALRFADE